MTAFKVDENLPIDVAELLRQHGHDAMTVYEQHLGGHPDNDIASVCRAENRALITLDLDFSNIRVYPPHKHPGIIVLRLDRQDKPGVLAAIEQVLLLLPCEPLVQRLWIVESDRVRIWSPR